ncbi:MAG TPA: nodulation protein NfeD [Dehalococcoidia bacterium]|nr:nodulation protein NfeD [Dehalococcoidia bacterium]
MPKTISILFLVSLLVTAFVATEAQAATPLIDVLHVNGTINPVLVDYVERGIEQAEEDNTIACIIQMDTPGGLDTSMRLIVQSILSAEVPVVVYIPSGARAASAGFFITIAAHVAVMAPGTEIGAAHPVAMSTEGEAEMSEAMKAKVVNDAAAYAISIADTHGRNTEWAEKAVREAASLPAHQALELNVIDMVAPDLDSLISQLDGWQATMLDGSVMTLHTQGATIKEVKMNWVEDFLYTISNPNIAYILLSLAMLGLMVEITNPGLVFPGIVGGICGLLAFYSLGMLPVNYAGVLLIVLAFGLFIAEVFTATFGLFTAGGVTSLIIGSLILFKGGPLFQINPWLIAVVSIGIAALFAFVINRVIKAHRYQATTGREELVGKIAIVKVALEPEGTVFFRGERWTAVSEGGRVEPGEEVIITKVDGLKLCVAKKQ